MSPVKEPHHYSSDFGYLDYKNRDAYLSLFAAVHEAHWAVGEASATYLLSSVAVPNIERSVPAAKFIVLLRNPIEMAPALHEQMYFSGDEDLVSFEAAWRAQAHRAEGKLLPRCCREPRFLQYREACNLGAQLDRLYRQVGRERVLVLFLEDMKRDPRGSWQRTLDFLDLPDDGRTCFPVKNQAKEWRFRGLLGIARTYRKALQILRVPPLGTGLFARVERANVRNRARPPLPPALHAELVDAFCDDIQLLSKLTARSLVHWLQTPSRS